MAGGAAGEQQTPSVDVFVAHNILSAAECLQHTWLFVGKQAHIWKNMQLGSLNGLGLVWFSLL